MGRRTLLVYAIPIVALMAFHAFMVFVVNLPDDPIKEALQPVMSRYDGPQLHQGWAIFAPNPPEVNPHVLVRGRLRDGSVTRWYDATLFFLDVVGKNHFSPLRELGEGLGHAALAASQYPNNIIARTFASRTAAMVLKLYVRRPLAAEEIELDVWRVPPIRRPTEKSVVVNRWPWQRMPYVAPLHI